MMPRRNDRNVESTPHQDGKKESIIKDPTGVQVGVETGDTHKLNPSFIDPERLLDDSNKKKDAKRKSPHNPWFE